jgi:ribonuclease-3
MTKPADNLEKRLKLKFKNKGLLKTAFIHRSYLNEHPNEKLAHNERLEFLGDAVLGLIVSNYLYNEYPNHPEGDLTNFRSSLVNARTLSKAASILKLGDCLYLSRGEEATGGRERQYILANTFEALIGAIFLDQGFGEAGRFIKEHLLTLLSEIIEKKLYKDFKSQLQEKAQEEVGFTPTYKLLAEKGPDHEKTFKIGVLVGRKRIGEGTGSSKQLAEQEAAKIALENWSKIN